MEKNINKKRKRTEENENKWINYQLETIMTFVPIEVKYEESLNDLLNNGKIEEIITKNNIEPEIDYKFLLKNIKDSNKYNYLKEALTSEYYKKLFISEIQINPFTIILSVFNEIIKKNETEVNKILKNIKFIGYNLPLIYGIERVRINYYLWLIKTRIKYEEFFAKVLSKFSIYLQFLNSLNHIDKCDQKEIDIIFYQFILEIIEVIFPSDINLTLIPTIYNKLNPDYIELKNTKNGTFIEDTNDLYDNYVQKINNEKYLVSNGIDKTIINEKDYNIKKLAIDINNYPKYPLSLLLYRNESINYYYSHNKSYIERESKVLFDSFKEYYFEFIKSENLKSIFSQPEYKYAEEFLNNYNYKKILLNEKYVKFIPFYNEIYAGFTNKDILLTLISAYPSIVKMFPNKLDKDKQIDIKNFCFLMSIGEKFLTLLHEQSIHFIYGYLYHLTYIKNIYQSPKNEKKKKKKEDESEDEFEDGGYYFEKQLFGSKIKELTITNVIALFDGVSTMKTNKEFRNIFNADFNKKNLMNMIKNSKGFLKIFLENFPINFDYILEMIKKLKNCYINTKGTTEPFIERSSIYINFDYIKFRNSKKYKE